MQMPKDWRELLEDQLKSAYYKKLEEFVLTERKSHPDSIFPSDDQVFHAFELTPVSKVKVLVLGQDPYPTRGHAHGLAFSVQPTVAPPASLRNIFKELNNDLGIPAPTTGILSAWAEQGVLLMNTVLTVREGEANSHQKQGWEKLTDSIIERLSERDTPIVFVLWGKPAQKKESLIDTSKHAVIQSAHPSPLSATRGFFGSKPFSQINQLLKKMGKTQIDWRLTQ